MDIDRAVLLLESVRVEVPTVVGWLKPVLIVPATFLIALPANQVEAILVHELAHIRRHDYLINLIQILIETLLFYHPAIWWISRTIRQEREHCCDDLAIQIVGDKFTYATALAALEESRSLPMAITLAAAGGSLLQRIRRLTGLRESPSGLSVWLAILTVVVVAGIVAAALRAEKEKIAADNDPLAGVDLTKQTFDASGMYNYYYHNAVVEDRLHVVAAFLRHGEPANPNVFLHGGDDVLGLAAWFTGDPRMIRLLLAHGAKPLGDAHSDNASVNEALEVGNKKIADLLIAAGGAVDPILYDAGLGQLEDLKKRSAARLIQPDELRHALAYAVKAGQVEVFDWLWPKVRQGKEPDDGKKLDGFYLLAAERGHLPLMLRLEELGVKVTTIGQKALDRAVMGNRLAEAKHLFDHGVTLSTPPKSWRSQLGEAAGEGHLEMVKLLLDHGADINARDGQGLPPLSWCAYGGHDAVCQLLIARGANLAIMDNQGQPPVWYVASGHYCPGALEMMVNRHVNLNTMDKRGDTLIQHAMSYLAPQREQSGYPGAVMTPKDLREFDARERRTIDLLIQGGMNPSGRAGSAMPLTAAIQGNHYVAADELLSRGADPRSRDHDDVNALGALFIGWRSQAFPMALLHELLRRGCTANDVFPYPGMTPRYDESTLEFAVSDSRGVHPSALPALRGAISELVRNGGRFPGVKSANDQDLLLGAATGDTARMQRSLSAGASVNAREHEGTGWSALMLALALDYPDMARWLIDHGADINTESMMDGSVLAFAVKSNQLDMVELLLAKGAKPDTGCLSNAVETGNQKIFDKLMEAGADPRGMSVFQCIQLGRVAMAKALLDHGARTDVFTFGKQGDAYSAVYYNQPEILKMVLNHGADPEMKSDYGETPLSRAKEQHPAMVPIIEEAIRRRHATGTEY